MTVRWCAGFLVFVILCPAPGRAQVVLGRVVERHERNPVAGALVTAEGSRAVTGPDGRFELFFARAGTAEVRVERLGYTPFDTVVGVGVDTVHVEFALDPRVLIIPGLEVNAPPGRAFEHLGGEVRVRVPDRMVRARGIGLDPTEEVAGSGIAASESDFSAFPIVRANRWDLTAMYLGPLRVWAPLHGLGLVGPAKISGTEEVRVGGAVPSVFESNVAGGTIRAQPRLEGGALWGRGGGSLLDVSVTTGGGVAGAGEFVVTATRSLDHGMLGSMWGGDLPLRYASVEGHARWRWSDGVVLRASGYLSQDSVSFGAASLSDNLESRWEVSAWAVGGRWRTGRRDALDLEIARSTYDADVAKTVAGGRVPGATNALTELRVAALWLREWGRASTLAGMDLSRIRTTLDGDPGRPGPAIQDEETARTFGFATGVETVTGRSAFRGGIRLDLARGMGVAVQPRADWTHELEKGWRVHASAGRSTQWVSALNAEPIVPQAPFWWAHAGPFGRTSADNVAVGGAGPLAPWLRVRGEAFVRRVSGLTRWVARWDGPSGIVQEDARAGGFGVDAVLWDGRSGTLRWDHTLAWVSVGERRRAPAWDIRHSGSVRLGWRPGRWEFAASANYASGRALPVAVGQFSGIEIGALSGLRRSAMYTIHSRDALRLPAYLRLDAGVSRDFDVGPATVQASLKVLNLKDRVNVLYHRLGNAGFPPPGASFPEWWLTVDQRLYPERQFRRLVTLGLHANVR